MAYIIGSIYRITKIDDNNVNYIGSTFKTLQWRWDTHKYQGTCSIGKYLNKYGCDKFKIELIKEYLVCDKIHLRAYEQLWINKYKMNKSCININDTLPLLRKEKTKNYYQHHYQHHKEQLKEQQKKYYQENKAQLLEQKKEYRLENKEQKKEYDKKYRQEHKEQQRAKQSEKITCECGCITRRDNMPKHKKTTKHFNLMNSN